MRVLIAEDDALVRRILELTLTQLGHECSVAEDGLEAWERYRAESPEVLITDWMMPGLSGPELCRRIRADEQGGYCYLILLTALDDHEHALAGIEAGADDHLTKPLNVGDLQIRLVAAARVTVLHARLAEREGELERLNLDLAQEARRDPLTRLGNRLRLEEDLAVYDARRVRYGHAYCVLLCDLDRFKALNDRQGHQAGDRVLCEVAATLRRESRTSDAVYRYGGEEFLVLLAEQTLEGALIVCERMREAVYGLGLAHPDTEAGVVTISIGAATCPPGGETDATDAIRRADLALYAAKAQGRDRVVADA